jgi:glutathione S-transferase
MLILHGFAMSNYYNMVKHALMVKDCEFTENKVYPQTEDILAITPTGKVPAITTEEGVHLSETSVILNYLEDLQPQPPLFPISASNRAKVRMLIKVTELYLELPSRRLMKDYFARQEPETVLADEVKTSFVRGCEIINQMTDIEPYLLGDQLSMADIFMYYALVIPTMVGPRLIDVDPVTAIKGLSNWHNLMSDCPISKKIETDKRDNAPEFMAKIGAR